MVRIRKVDLDMAEVMLYLMKDEVSPIVKLSETEKERMLAALEKALAEKWEKATPEERKRFNRRIKVLKGELPESEW